MRLQPEPVIKMSIGSHPAGGNQRLCLLPLEGDPKSLKNKGLRQRGLFDQIFMNLIMKWITC